MPPTSISYYYDTTKKKKQKKNEKSITNRRRPAKTLIKLTSRFGLTDRSREPEKHWSVNPSAIRRMAVLPIAQHAHRSYTLNRTQSHPIWQSHAILNDIVCATSTLRIFVVSGAWALPASLLICARWKIADSLQLNYIKMRRKWFFSYFSHFVVFFFLYLSRVTPQYTSIHSVL